MDTTTAGMLRFAAEGGQVGGAAAATEFNSLLEPIGRSSSSGAGGGSAAAAMMLVMAEAFAMEWNDTFVASSTESLNETYQDNNSTAMAGGDNEPQFYSPLYRIIGTFFQGIIFLVGVLGNVMVVYVVAKSKAMRSPTNCYLVSLAIADCITLIASVPQEILSYYLVGNKWIWGSIGCAGFIYSQNVSINASALSLTAFTIERYIAICHPMRAHSVCTVRRAKKILIGVWIFAVCYCSPWLFLTTTIPLEYEGYNDSVQCVHKVNRKNDIYIAYYMADLVTFYVIPLILSTILYTRIARTLFLSNRATRSQEYNAPGNQQLTAAPTTTKSHSSRVQVIKMLVMVVVIFAILWLPYRGLLVYNSFMSPPFMNLWFLMLAKTCIFINSAINPILYNAMSIKFRTEFSRTLRCWKRTGSHKNGTTFRSRLGTSTTMTHLPSPITGTYHENTSLSSSSSHGDATDGLNSHHRTRSTSRRKHPYSMTSAAQRTSRGKSRTAETSAAGGHLQIYTSVGAGTSVVNCNSIPFSVHDNVTQL